ncbi:hypothetical protein Tco_0269743 [Tanacetum coccineum]
MSAILILYYTQWLGDHSVLATHRYRLKRVMPPEKNLKDLVKCLHMFLEIWSVEPNGTREVLHEVVKDVCGATIEIGTGSGCGGRVIHDQDESMMFRDTSMEFGLSDKHIGMDVDDAKSPHVLRPFIDDYPCAVDGLEICLNSIPADNVPAGRSSSIPADYVSAGHVLVPADSDRIC